MKKNNDTAAKSCFSKKKNIYIMGLSMSRYVLSNLLHSTSMLLFLLLHLLMLQLGNKNFNLFTLSGDSFFFCLQIEMPCSTQQPMTKSQLIHWPANQWLDLATASNWLAKQQSASDILLRLCSMWFANSFKQKRTHTHTQKKTVTSQRCLADVVKSISQSNFDVS